MFYTQRSSGEVREFLTQAGWEIGDLYPGPEGFFPRRTETPHLHFTLAGNGGVYLHWKNTSNQATEIEGFYIPGCPETLKGKALDLLGMLKR